jgi:hypothetical protein
MCDNVDGGNVTSNDAKSEQNAMSAAAPTKIPTATLKRISSNI